MALRSPLTEPDVPPLAATLDVDRIDDHLFLGAAHEGEPARAYGGEVAGCALVAAGRSVPPGRLAHSAHCHFLRAGDSSLPIVYRVQPVRHGRTYSVLHVEAAQHDRPIFHLTASFALAGPAEAAAAGGESTFQEAAPDVPAPEDLPPPWEAFSGQPDTLAWLASILARRPLDVRYPQPPAFELIRRDGVAPPHQRAWMRSADPLGEDPLLHAAALAYLSDLGILASALAPHGRTFADPAVSFATLDHTVWFHGVPTTTDWLLYDTRGVWTGAGRGLSRGSLTDRRGRLVASTVQEGVLRFPA